MSNVESAEEETLLAKRTSKRPSKFAFSSDEDENFVEQSLGKSKKSKDTASGSTTVSDSGILQSIALMQEMLSVVMQRLDALTAIQQETLHQFSQVGGARQGCGPDTRGSCCLGGNTKRASGLQKEIDTPSQSDWWCQPR
ncbi:hypothetical protein UPYG_G00258060 [Umbra pygmaea]|uniref:Uncharacterized protein n=1 Tax=Umbra pygmaea TaxID=75934 RepID=A0ABD0WYU4_UMBPY